jgi:hypothetical protein
MMRAPETDIRIKTRVTRRSTARDQWLQPTLEYAGIQFLEYLRGANQRRDA